jgi:hypothetical protein
MMANKSSMELTWRLRFYFIWKILTGKFVLMEWSRRMHPRVEFVTLESTESYIQRKARGW